MLVLVTRGSGRTGLGHGHGPVRRVGEAGGGEGSETLRRCKVDADVDVLLCVWRACVEHGDEEGYAEDTVATEVVFVCADAGDGDLDGASGVAVALCALHEAVGVAGEQDVRIV